MIEAADLLLTGVTAAGVGAAAYWYGLTRGRRLGRATLEARRPVAEAPEDELTPPDEDEAAEARSLASRKLAGLPLADLAASAEGRDDDLPMVSRGPAEVAEDIELVVIEGDTGPAEEALTEAAERAQDPLAGPRPDAGELVSRAAVAAAGLLEGDDVAEEAPLPDPEPPEAPLEADNPVRDLAQAVREVREEMAAETDAEVERMVAAGELPPEGSAVGAPQVELIGPTLAELVADEVAVHGEAEAPLTPRVLPIVRRIAEAPEAAEADPEPDPEPDPEASPAEPPVPRSVVDATGRPWKKWNDPDQ